MTGDDLEGRFRVTAVRRSGGGAASGVSGGQKVGFASSGTSAASRGPFEPNLHHRRPHRLPDGEWLLVPTDSFRQAACSRLSCGLRLAFPDNSSCVGTGTVGSGGSRGNPAQAPMFWGSAMVSPSLVEDPAAWFALMDEVSHGRFLTASPVAASVGSGSGASNIWGSRTTNCSPTPWAEASWLQQWGTHYTLAAFVASRFEVLLVHAYAATVAGAVEEEAVAAAAAAASRQQKSSAQLASSLPCSLPLADVWSSMSIEKRESGLRRIGGAVLRKLLSEVSAKTAATPSGKLSRVSAWRPSEKLSDLLLGSAGITSRRDVVEGVLVSGKSSNDSRRIADLARRQPAEFIGSITAASLAEAALLPLPEEATSGGGVPLLFHSPQLWLHQQLYREVANLCSEHSASSLIDGEVAEAHAAATDSNGKAKRRSKKQRQRIKHRQALARGDRKQGEAEQEEELQEEEVEQEEERHEEDAVQKMEAVKETEKEKEKKKEKDKEKENRVRPEVDDLSPSVLSSRLWSRSTADTADRFDSHDIIFSQALAIESAEAAPPMLPLSGQLGKSGGKADGQHQQPSPSVKQRGRAASLSAAPKAVSQVIQPRHPSSSSMPQKPKVASGGPTQSFPSPLPPSATAAVAKSEAEVELEVEADQEEDTRGPLPPGGAELQRYFGPQSKRGKAQQFQLDALGENSHAQTCFDQFARNEEEFCGDWAVFYHSYSDAALLYEVFGALAAVLFGFPSKSSPLPRILTHPFQTVAEDAQSLKEKFESTYCRDMKDHHPDYRAVALSAMCSLVSKGPEVSTPVIFVGGYSHTDDRPAYDSVLEGLLSQLVPRKWITANRDVKKLMGKIYALAIEYNLEISQVLGKDHDQKRSGHLLQIFIRREFVDRLVYAAEPWGFVDKSREPISSWVDADKDTSWGQARIVAHPAYFMQQECVRMFLASSDPAFHRDRETFQDKLVELFSDWFADPAVRRSAVNILSNSARRRLSRRRSW
eukprot:TRINITY_DN10948_c0_g1_i1.p1 TRINITY_DN10948_c0_g1~~TRINITY_DN10948_c0_g1_i1.p1  ORF type:complete len:1123 (-),score=206.26 TRINITY_DN10948_c0_g1_i1:258-3227(-)